MYKEAFDLRDDLKEFGENALLLFALILRFGFEDIESVASDALTGDNDKKADLIYVDPDEGIAIIAQTYIAQDENRTEAPANKASDLNTAASWLLSVDQNNLPIDIQNAAIRLREAISDKKIKEIEIWYVHNLPNSKNVEEELYSVENTTISLLQKYFPLSEDIEVRAIEVGRDTLDEWYSGLKTPILITDEIEVPIKGGYEVTGDNWKAFSTTVSTKFLFDLFKKHKKKIFSANIRDYLGSRKTDSNINYGIKETATKEQKKFWVFNNGITAITNGYQPQNDKLKLSGLSIVNGAQTTGSVGNLSQEPTDECLVAIRFIKCNDHKTVQNIVKFNNSQNQITAADFRSSDEVQDRLRREFKDRPDTVYTGARRGGAEDAIKRNPNLLSADYVAQALAAFHLSPNISYNQKSDIWKSDKIYSDYFNENLTARHIILACSLLTKIQMLKINLFRKSKAGEELLETEKKKLEFLRLRGAHFILMSAISYSAEVLLNKPIPNRFRLSFGDKQLKTAIELWGPIIDITIPFSSQLILPLQNNLKNEKEIDSVIKTFRSLVDATATANATIFSTFAKNVVTI